MSISGVNSALTGVCQYADKAQKTAAGRTGFAEQLQKTGEAAQNEAVDYDEKAFEMVGPNAPQCVKDAWMEAAGEVNANGLGIRKNGMMSHISQMMVQRCNKMLRGEADYSDVLGRSVESAIRAAKQALYDLDHPLAPGYRSPEAQQARIKERAFYVAFLEKLEEGAANL